MTTQSREFPKCCRATGVDLNEWHFIKKQMIRFPQHLSSFVPQQNTRNSHRGISSGRAEHWDTMENSWFCPSAPISKPALPAAGRAELGELKGLWGAQRGFGEHLEMLSWSKHNPRHGKGTWEEHPSFQQRGNFSLAPGRAENHQRRAPISPASECFIFLLPLMNLSWRFVLITLIWNSSIWKAGSTAGIPAAWQMQLFWASIASSASSSSIPFLFQTLNVHLYSLMVRK